jgi:uncharacterized protein (TIGR04255 family)
MKDMAQPEHLAKAPIVEALFDLQVSVPSSVNLETLASLQDQLKGYPQKEIRSEWTSALQINPDEPPVARTHGGPIGYLFRSADGLQAVQARLTGFSFSRFKPYTSWDSFIGEGRALWESYAALVRPVTVNRVALRYINSIPLPTGVFQLKDYVLTLPEIAPGLPQELADLFFRVVLPDASTPATAIITEAIVGREQRSPALILDIDVFLTGLFVPSLETHWALLERMRALKNRIFFDSLTERAKEMFR